MLLITVITRPLVPAQDFRATVENICDRPPMAGEQIRPEPVQVSTAITLKDIRSLRGMAIHGGLRDRPSAR
jgi:hypothetical protein